MPFGAGITPEGVRFRLWAPGCRQVGLCLEDGTDGPARAMAPRGDGWFSLTLPGARAGTRYRFQVDGGLRVPDPASRFNPQDVHGASEVVDPGAFQWRDSAWLGRPWPEAVLYELHVGAFTPEGSFQGVARRLDYLADLGVTGIELMPVADFRGARGWGYDGVLLFAPHSRYGRPEDLKTLVQEAHRRGLMVLLDVVYNHFGPEGNYLHAYAGAFFRGRHRTPWGAAINFDGPGSGTVRDFFIHNALYWLEEYHLDGLRLDAVHAISDHSRRPFLAELAERVRAALEPGRQVHLVLENDANEARLLGPGGYTAQWNDDCHHALHVLCTGETDGYYADYSDQPIRHLGRCLAEGFAYQGEASPFRGRRPRGGPSAQLPAQSFVSFLQCHDQVGNRAFGERITDLAPAPAVLAAAAVYLLAPAIPMVFMGEEFAALTPFLYFCDFDGELGRAVTEGRRRESGSCADPRSRAALPDPNLEASFLRSKLDWGSLDQPAQASRLAYYRELLRIRRDLIVPRLAGGSGGGGSWEVLSAAGLRAEWRLGDGSRLLLLANFSWATVQAPAPEGAPVFVSSPEAARGLLGPWSLAWTLVPAGGGP
jgi:1,4-alpha-glucan branching enzyme/maltooligosyltrehalose trehalohydrolase